MSDSRPYKDFREEAANITCSQYVMSGIFFEGKWYENTDMICRRCGSPVYQSDNPEYAFQCFCCDEDLYEFEVKKQKARYLPPVMIARPIDGIALNDTLEYLLDGSGQPRVFNNQPQAEAFLLGHGVDLDDLEFFFFVEAEENNAKLRN